MTTGEIIKAERKKAGLTQVELGKKIGVSGSMIGQWENNLRNPKNESILKLGSVLGESFIEVLYSELKFDLPWQLLMKLSGRSDDYIRDLEEREKNTEVRSRNDKKRLKQNIKIFINSEDGQDLIASYFMLNECGRAEAVSRIYELTFIPKFSDIL